MRSAVPLSVGNASSSLLRRGPPSWSDDVRPSGSKHDERSWVKFLLSSCLEQAVKRFHATRESVWRIFSIFCSCFSSLLLVLGLPKKEERSFRGEIGCDIRNIGQGDLLHAANRFFQGNQTLKAFQIIHDGVEQVLS